MRPELTAVVHDRVHPLVADVGHFEREQAVVQENARAHPHVGGERVVGGGDLPRRGLRFRREGDRLAGLEMERLHQRAHADARALEIQQHRDRVAPVARHLAKLLDPSGADLGGAVGGVDADDVDARVEQRGHLAGAVPRGAQRGDDLGATNRTCEAWEGV